MSGRVHAEAKAASKSSFTPVRTGLLQCSSASHAGPATVPPIVQEVLRSPGQPLDPETRVYMEPRLGHDFRRVRIHDAAPTTIQTKLTIGQPNDRYELEADRVADQVLAAPAYPRISGTVSSIQRYTGQLAGDAGTAPASVDHVLASPGRPLEPALWQDMEQRFGHDFSQVRVHIGGAAEQSTREVDARAYTVGNNVVFGTSQFEPQTNEGLLLLAHELTHVIQQQSSIGSVYPTMLPNSSEREPNQNKNHLLPYQKTGISQKSFAHRLFRQSDPNHREEREYFIVPEIHTALAEREREVPSMRSAPQNTCEPFHGPLNQPRVVSQQLIDRLMGKYAREGDPGEGCIEEPYIAGKTERVCTIGYGRQIPTCPIVDRASGRMLSMDERMNANIEDLKCQCEGQEHFECKGKDAEEDVRSYIGPKAAEVHRVVPINLTQSEFDALVDITLHVGHIPEKLLQAIKLYWCTGEGMNYVRSVYLNTALTRPGLKRIEPGFVSRRKHRVWPWYMQEKRILSEQGDVYEQEADRIAEQVLAASVQPAARGAPPRIQRFIGYSNGHMEDAPASVDQALTSPGRPLEPALRQDMEQRFGHDFSRVQVHSGEAAEQSTREVNAHAYTVGHNIVFGASQFAPGTHEGRRLIAHELTHVVQQLGEAWFQTGQRDINGALNYIPLSTYNYPLARRKNERDDPRQKILRELQRPMPAAILGMIDELIPTVRDILREDSEIKESINRLPEGARLQVQWHFLYGRTPPSELADLYRAVSKRDIQSVKRILEQFRQKREAEEKYSIEVGNIKEIINYRFRDTKQGNQINKLAESALEFDWGEMLNFARNSPRFRELELKVLGMNSRRLPGEKGTPGGGTFTNIHSGAVIIEPAVSLRGAVIRYVHELSNFASKNSYEQIYANSKDGFYSNRGDCARALIRVELNSVILRELVANELGFTYEPKVRAILEKYRVAEFNSVMSQVFDGLEKLYANPTSGTGASVFEQYRQQCRD